MIPPAWSENVYYVSGKGFVVDRERVKNKDGGIVKVGEERNATDREIGRALRTGKLFNTSKIKLIHEIG